MSAPEPSAATAQPLRPTPDLQARADAATFALLPPLAVLACLTRSPAWSIAAGLALIAPILRRWLDRNRNTAVWRIVPNLLLIAVWLPVDAMPARIAAMAGYLVLCALWRDRDAANPFHPAMIAIAVVLLAWPATPAAMPPDHALVLAASAALGGLFLLLRGAIRWQAPTGMLAGAAIAIMGGLLWMPALNADPMLPALLPSLVLTALFIADDPPRTCMQPRARGLLGALIGLLAMAAMLVLHATQRDAHMLPTLAGMVLLGNAAAPTFDRWFATPRKPRPTTP